MADTHYPRSYEIPRWVRPRRRRSSVPLRRNISRDLVPRIYVSAKRLLPIPLYPRPYRHPCALPYPTRAVSPFPLPLSIVIMETIILLSPWLLFSPIALSLPFAPSLSFSLSLTISRTPSTSHGVFSILPLPPLLLLSLCDRSSLSFYLRIHGFQRNVSFYRCTDRKRNVFAARSATMRCADGKGNGRSMVVLVRMMVMVMVVAAAAVAAATASYLFARLRSNHRFV